MTFGWFGHFEGRGWGAGCKGGVEAWSALAMLPGASEGEGLGTLKCMMRPNGLPFVSFLFQVSQQYATLAFWEEEGAGWFQWRIGGVLEL